MMQFDSVKLRQQFPILSQLANEHPLVYLDNAATTQKPNCVIDAIMNYYQTSNANVHRGSHFLSDRATNQFEQARQTVSSFIQAPTESHIIWCKGTTEAINQVAYGLEAELEADDEILISSLEHHANLVPWQQLAKRTGAKLRSIPFTSDAKWESEYAHYFTDKTKILACTQISNALGVSLPLDQLIQEAKRVGALTLIDGAQVVAHYPVNVTDLDCDFYVFSGHKMYAPTGIGVLYGKTAALERLTPLQTGGEMVLKVSLKETEFNQLPYRLEAGTPHIEGVIGLAAACDFLMTQDRQAMLDWEIYLANRVRRILINEADIKVFSPANSTLVSFTVNHINELDLNGFLDSKGIGIRSGSHCAHPLMAQLGVSGTLRASFACYNNERDADHFVATLLDAIDLLSD